MSPDLLHCELALHGQEATYHRPYLSIVSECKAVEGTNSNLGDLLLAQALDQLGLSYVSTAVCPQAIVVSFAPGMGKGERGG